MSKWVKTDLWHFRIAPSFSISQNTSWGRRICVQWPVCINKNWVQKKQKKQKRSYDFSSVAPNVQRDTNEKTPTPRVKCAHWGGSLVNSWSGASVLLFGQSCMCKNWKQIPFFLFLFLSMCIYRLGHADRRLLTKFWAVGSSLSFWFEQDSDVGRPEARIRLLWRTVSFGLQDLSNRLNRTGSVRRVKTVRQTASRNSLHILLGLDVRGTRAGEPRSLASKLNKLRKKERKKTIQGTNKYCKMEIQLSNEHIVLTALDTSSLFFLC